MFTISGIPIGDNPLLTKLAEGIETNTTNHSFYGQNAVKVEQASISGRKYDLTLLMERCNFNDPDNQNNIELLEETLQGLVLRNSPLMLNSTDHALHGSASTVFIVVKSYSTNWRTGTQSGNMFAEINLSCEFIGTLGNLTGSFCISAYHRPSDYTGLIASQSVIALPKHDGVRIINIPYKAPDRFGTQLMDLGSVPEGFANDTITAEADDVESGEVLFGGLGIDMYDNALRVYDDGYTNPHRVVSREHEYDGSMVIESELYRIIIKTDGSYEVSFYQAIAVGYAAVPFKTLKVDPYFLISTVINQDEFVRVRFDNGWYLEIERAKDPVIIPAAGVNYLEFIGNTGVTDSTDESPGTPQNYVAIDTNTYVSSQFGFTTADNGANFRVIKKDAFNTDQVFAICYYDDTKYGGETFNDSRRFAEVLVEIS